VGESEGGLMTEMKRDRGPEWPERLLHFNEYDWTEAEIWEAAEAYALDHARANALAEPLPADAWESHLRPEFAWSYFRRRWAREHGREHDLIDQMIQNRLERGRRLRPIGLDIEEDQW
jgi:hypothetical protein